MATVRFGGVVLVGWSLALVACVEQPGAERIIGPDGTQMLHVHCGDEQVACFQMAGERCPHGYDLSPIFDPHDGNFLVRCRTPMTTPGFVAAAATQPAHASTQPRPNEGWPPSEVAMPTEPWPAPSSTALPPAPRTATGAVDIGY
ncbi:MAG TPA: hypothetical protein VHW01_27880 [Polyangiaceae bacterium]|jgi:hypothetical protein|nr:hypothetical protein [Polyangiaceae bacterium]